jgi:hypothetical protein
MSANFHLHPLKYKIVNFIDLIIKAYKVQTFTNIEIWHMGRILI